MLHDTPTTVYEALQEKGLHPINKCGLFHIRWRYPAPVMPNLFEDEIIESLSVYLALMHGVGWG